MEIVVIALVGYIVYRIFKSTIPSKSLVASEIQKRFDLLARTSFQSFEGDVHVAAQQYVEKYWDTWKPQLKKHKVRSGFMALLILREAAVHLHNENDENADFVIEALALITSGAMTHGNPSNDGEGAILVNAVKTVSNLGQLRTSKSLCEDIERLSEIDMNKVKLPT
jgi:hypothetical protein